MIQNLLLKWIVLVSLLIAAVSCVPLLSGSQLTPTNDPFYKPDALFENTKPGTILRTRVLPEKSLAAFSLLPENIQGVYQFLFRSSDALDQPTAVVTTLLVPANADTSKLLSYQVFQDSASFDCAPSYILQKGSGIQGIIPQAEILFINSFISRGYYVVVPDYEGPGGFFTVGKNSGQGVLDSIRAVLSSGKQTQLQADAQVQLYGYSGGAIATGWAAQLKALYAPELNIIGAVIGGTPVNLKLIFDTLNKSAATGLLPAALHGLSGQYPDLADFLYSSLKPETKETFMAAKNSCIAPLEVEFAFQDIGDYYTRSDYVTNPIVARRLEENNMGNVGTPKIPTFMYHATHDPIIGFKPVEDMYNTWCSSVDSQTSIEFVEDLVSEHSTVMITGAPAAFGFIIDGFNGHIRKPGCSKRTTITSAIDPNSVEIFGKLIFDNLNGVLGAPIGPNSIF